MNCRTIRRKDIIEDYLAHRLGEALADEFETHLLGCSRCSTLLENMQSLRDGLEERASSIRTAVWRKVAQDWSVRKANKEDLRVSGWKEIADSLGCSLRQVQSWEKSEGFPVRRHLSGKVVTVYAHGSEIDAWLTRQQLGFDPKKKKLDAGLRPRGENLSKGTDTLDAAFRFPQEQSTTEEKTKKPSKQ